MTDQEKREKVIEGLERLLHSGKMYDAHLVIDTCEAAIAILKAQEPRVLSIQEIHPGMAVWLEDIDKEDVILAIGGSSCGDAKCFITEKDVSVNALDAEYNTRWRAWTDEPTTARRKAVKWE